MRRKLWLIPAAVVLLLPAAGQATNTRDLGGPGVWSLPNVPELSPAGGVPFNSKGEQVWEERRRTKAADPEKQCLPSGVPRIMHEPRRDTLTLDYAATIIISGAFAGSIHTWH